METTKLLPQYTDIPGLSNIGYDNLVATSRELRLEKSRIEKELKDTNTIIKDFMEGCECPEVMVNGLKVAVIQSRSSRIDKKELLARGVDPIAISESTKTTEYSFIKVTV